MGCTQRSLSLYLCKRDGESKAFQEMTHCNHQGHRCSEGWAFQCGHESCQSLRKVLHGRGNLPKVGAKEISVHHGAITVLFSNVLWCVPLWSRGGVLRRAPNPGKTRKRHEGSLGDADICMRLKPPKHPGMADTMKKKGQDNPDKRWAMWAQLSTQTQASQPAVNNGLNILPSLSAMRLQL